MAFFLFWLVFAALLVHVGMSLIPAGIISLAVLLVMTTLGVGGG